ncbi:MAG: aldose epimerase family protein [Pseudomonadota bacterium]
MTEFLKIESSGLTAAVSPIGAALARLWLKGHETSLILGFERPKDYVNAPGAIGVIIAPIAGRIASASAPLGERVLKLDANAPPDTLHGGRDGAQHKEWQVIAHHANAITLRMDMADDVCGLPGNRRFDVTYRVEGSTLDIDVESTSDADTFVNVTSHAYWVLDDSGGLQDHILHLPTTRMLEASAALIPTGKILDVTGGDFDFSNGGNPVVGPDLDGCFCLRERSCETLQPVLSLRSRVSGIKLDVTSTEPGVILYTGSGLSARSNPAKTPKIGPLSGLAIEAQKWPDAPNHLNFPSIMLHSGDRMRQMTRFFLSRSQC